jgi:hypothetical protein
VKPLVRFVIVKIGFSPGIFDNNTSVFYPFSNPEHIIRELNSGADSIGHYSGFEIKLGKSFVPERVGDN